MDLSLKDEEIEERYFLLGRMEILSCLNDLIRTREGVTVYFNQGKDFLFTTLLEAGFEHLLFDLSGDEKANRRLEHAQGCSMVAVHDGIRIQFSSKHVPQRFSWGGADAFRVPLPTRIVRLQRRETYRVELPVNKPVLAQVTDEKGLLLCELPIHDLSAGGAGLSATGESKLAEGSKVEVAFRLKDGRLTHSRAQVRHVTQISNAAASHPIIRIGLCFIDVPVSLSAKVQRYILEIEHQRNALVKKKE